MDRAFSCQAQSLSDTARKTSKVTLLSEINAGLTSRWCNNPVYIPAKPHNTSLMFPFIAQHWKNIWSATTAGIYYG